MSTEVDNQTDVLLQTKLHRPPLPGDFIPREGLIKLLERERTRPVVLVSAPAGYGKSILVTSWLEATEWESTWLSLDDEDTDLNTFLSYVTAALDVSFPGACLRTQTLLKATELPSLNLLATVFSNELDAIKEPFILVLDDYHRINPMSEVHNLLERLISHPPIPMHLVIVSRLDPPLSLERQRGLGQVMDVRLLDLRLDRSETRALLEKSANVDANDAVLTRLETALEGWVVGLKLVALALRNFPDPDSLLSRFRSGTFEMQAYLVGEVLNSLPQDARDCLTRTALLNRFCAPLCKAVCERPGDPDFAAGDGEDFLRFAYSRNLFVIPLDTHGTWYRYHHLFQELLQRELVAKLDSESVNAIHMTASKWYEENGHIDEAIRHALEAGDEKAAVKIVQRHRVRQLNANNWTVVERWMQMLPDIKDQHADLLLARAWIENYERFNIKALPGVLKRISELPDHPIEETPLWGEMQFLQGAALFWAGEAEAGQQCFKAAEECLPNEHQLFLGLTRMMSGFCTHMQGKTEKAIEELEGHVSGAPSRQGLYYSRLLAGLNFASIMSGDLGRARAEALRMESVASEARIQYTVAWSRYMQACTHLHRFELEQAARFFELASKDCYILHRVVALESFTGLALCQQLMGKAIEAQNTLGRLTEFATELSDPFYLNIVQSSHSRIEVLRGTPENARDWAVGSDDVPGFAELFTWMEVPALGRARVWITLGSHESLNRALILLEKISKRCEEWNLVNQAIETGALYSLCLEKLGRHDEAIDSLSSVLQLAGTGGWTRPFLELGADMASLIRRLAGQRKLLDFGQQLLSLYDQPIEVEGISQIDAPMIVDIAGGMTETLTKRELEILLLLAQRLQTKEMAAKLFVSTETVKSHIKRLYQKLDVHNRRDVAAFARSLIKSGRL